MLNELWRQILSLKEKTEKINAAYAKMHPDETWDRQAISTYDVDKMVRDAKEKLVKTAVVMILKEANATNIIVGEEFLQGFMKNDGFNEKVIRKALQAKYIVNAQGIALQQIKQKTERLLNLRYDHANDRRIYPGLKELVSKAKLTLHIYFGGGSVHYSAIEYIQALEKLINVTLAKQNPAEAQTLGISTAIEEERIKNGYRDYSQAKTYDFKNSFVTSFKLYKNGKFEVIFRRETDARKVAKALIS